MKHRDAGIDSLRSFAILAIVAGHVWETPLTRDILYPWHVPVFFFLTGYLWTAGRTIPNEIFRRSKTLLKPYIFWGVSMYAFYAATHLVTGGSVADLRLGPLYGGLFAVGMFGTFWFVSALFTTAVLWRIIERLPVAARVAIAFGGVVAGALFGPTLASTPLAIGTALPALALVGSGQVARKIKLHEFAAAPPIALVAIALSMGLVLMNAVESLGIKEGNWGTPVLTTLLAIAISWSLVILAERLSSSISAKDGAAISHVTLTGFTVVLFHFTVVIASDRLGLPSWLSYILAIAIPLVIGLVALRTPLSQWVTGAPRLRSAPSTEMSANARLRRPS